MGQCGKSIAEAGAEGCSTCPEFRKPTLCPTTCNWCTDMSKTTTTSTTSTTTTTTTTTENTRTNDKSRISNSLNIMKSNICKTFCSNHINMNLIFKNVTMDPTKSTTKELVTNGLIILLFVLLILAATELRGCH